MMALGVDSSLGSRRVARVRALLRRWDRVEIGERRAEPETEAIRYGDLVICPALNQVTKCGEEVPLTKLEFRLLHLLASHPNQVFTREELMEAVWGSQRNVTLRSVDTYFWRLRDKLEADPKQPVHLRTTRGSGYAFEVTQDSATNVLPIRAKTHTA